MIVEFIELLNQYWTREIMFELPYYIFYSKKHKKYAHKKIKN